MDKIDTKVKWRDAFRRASRNGELERVRDLCHKKYKSVQEFRENVGMGLHWGCLKGHVEVVKFLVLSEEALAMGGGAHYLNSNDEWCFRKVCARGNLELVRFLTTSEELRRVGYEWVNIHACNDDGFKMACQNGHWKVAKFLAESPELIKCGHRWVDMKELGSYALEHACIKKNEEALKWLIFDCKIERPKDLDVRMEWWSEEIRLKVEGYFKTQEEYSSWKEINWKGDGMTEDQKSQVKRC